MTFITEVSQVYIFSPALSPEFQITDPAADFDISPRLSHSNLTQNWTVLLPQELHSILHLN